MKNKENGKIQKKLHKKNTKIVFKKFISARKIFQSFPKKKKI